MNTREHNLKIWPEHFAPVVAGQKRAELRINDRGYQVGDTLNLCEWIEEDETFTGEFIRASVTHIAELPAVAGYVLLSFELMDRQRGKEQSPAIFAGGTEQRRASKELLEMYLKEPDCHVAKWMAIELLERRHDEKAFNGTVTAQTAEALKLSGEDLKALQGRVEGELKPFMYGIADPDGAAHFGEFCVSSDAAHVEDEVHQLNEQCTEDGEPLYKVVPLYRLPELEKEGE